LSNTNDAYCMNHIVIFSFYHLICILYSLLPGNYIIFEEGRDNAPTLKDAGD
jgi:hypothetical protein